MISIQGLVQSMRSWRRRRASTSKPRRQRSSVAMEQLDHRQLMSVDFTGNVVIDFPESTMPGVVVLRPDPDDPGFAVPLFPPEPPELEEIIQVSGFQLDAIRVSYDAVDDIFSVGLEQPDNQMTGQPVIAGDADNNLDGGTVSQAVQDLATTVGFIFQDPGLLGGSETMSINIDFLNNDDSSDPLTFDDNVVAGVPPAGTIDPVTGELLPQAFIVTEAVFETGSISPDFGTQLPEFAGTSFLANAPGAPNFEFQVRNFSELFEQETGMVLTDDSRISVSAFAGSQVDDGITEAQLPLMEFEIGDATPLPPPPPPVVQTPTVLINPHEDRHIDSSHRTVIRVYVFGGPDFDVMDIVPESVRLGDASPIRPPFFARQNHDSFDDATFFFLGNETGLPPGRTVAEITGTLTDGTPFRGSAEVFNRPPGVVSSAITASKTLWNGMTQQLGTAAQSFGQRINAWREVLVARRTQAAVTQQEHQANRQARAQLLRTPVINPFPSVPLTSPGSVSVGDATRLLTQPPVSNPPVSPLTLPVAAPTPQSDVAIDAILDSLGGGYGPTTSSPVTWGSTTPVPVLANSEPVVAVSVDPPGTTTPISIDSSVGDDESLSSAR